MQWCGESMSCLKCSKIRNKMVTEFDILRKIIQANIQHPKAKL